MDSTNLREGQPCVYYSSLSASQYQKEWKEQSRGHRTHTWSTGTRVVGAFLGTRGVVHARPINARPSNLAQQTWQQNTHMVTCVTCDCVIQSRTTHLKNHFRQINTRQIKHTWKLTFAKLTQQIKHLKIHFCQINTTQIKDAESLPLCRCASFWWWGNPAYLFYTLISTYIIYIYIYTGFAIRLRRILKLIGETQKSAFAKVAKGYTGKSTGIPKYESTYTASAFRVYLYYFDVYIQLGNNDR